MSHDVQMLSFLFPSHFLQLFKEHFSHISLLLLSSGTKNPSLHLEHFFPILSHSKQSSPQEIFSAIVVSTLFKPQFIISFLLLYSG